MASIKKEFEPVMKRLKDDKIQYVSLQFVDIEGNEKTKEIPADVFINNYRNGQGFDGSSIQGFVRIKESDMLLRPDKDTYEIIPWSDYSVARLVGDVYNEGVPFEGCPRRVLKNNVTAMKERFGNDTEFLVAPEPEFHFFEEKNGDFVHADNGDYFSGELMDIRLECAEMLGKVSIQAEAIHHEVGPGQHEICFAHGDALKIADQMVLYKQAIKAVAGAHGLVASFMPKPFSDKPGSGMHVHINMKKNGENLFFHSHRQTGNRRHLSDNALYFMGGLMYHARGLSPIISALPNSYVRLGASEAPKHVVWAHQNRSAYIRVPPTKPGEYGSTRIELRAPDPACNSYLAFATMLAAGMDGIYRKLDPGEPTDKNMQEGSYGGIQRLPDSLGEALGCLEKDEVICRALGEHCLTEFLTLKHEEWDAYRSQVSHEDRRNYINA